MVHSTKLRFNPQVGEDKPHLEFNRSRLHHTSLNYYQIHVSISDYSLVNFPGPGPGKMEDFPAPNNSQWPAPAILGLPGPGQNPAPSRPLPNFDSDFVTSSIHMSSHPYRGPNFDFDFVTSSIHMSSYPYRGPNFDSDFVTSSIHMSSHPYRGPNFDSDFVTSSIHMSSYP